MPSRLSLNIKPASVSQILMTSFFIITIPAMWLAWSMISGIEGELNLHVEYFQTGEIESFASNNSNLLKVGRFLRANNLPFADLERLDDANKDPKLLIWAEGMKDAKAALIYSWALIFVLGIATYTSVSIRVNRSFLKLFNDVQTLQSDQKNQSISIEGPPAMRDISASLESFRLKLNDDEQHQTAFLRHISHEIKTPLTSIKEGSTLLNENELGPMTSEQKEVARILLKSSNELQSAVENLLNYNVISSSMDDQSRQTTELSKLIEIALGKHRLIIKQKKVSIEVDAYEVTAFVNEKKILTIFENLISNAIKHAPSDSCIELTLQAEKEDKVSFIIKDQGPGINESQKQSIFDPFFVGDSSEYTSLKGTGLGLSIAKQYAVEHQGDINLVESHAGAAFQVILPLNSK